MAEALVKKKVIALKNGLGAYGLPKFESVAEIEVTQADLDALLERNSIALVEDAPKKTKPPSPGILEAP